MTTTISSARLEARHATIDLLTQLAHESDHGAPILALARHASECQRLKSEPLSYWTDLRRRVVTFRLIALRDPKADSLPYMFHGLAGTMDADVRWEVPS